ncbi:MAG: DUF2975 domain-containing protein [Actinobacteria bacterium]|nr:DUF2975 domain-containing protein [Actinomycetota bacterium]
MKQKEMARLLKAIDMVSIIACLILAFYMAPLETGHLIERFPDLAICYWPLLAIVWVIAIPLLLIGILAWMIFVEIGNDNSFSEINAKRLRRAGILAFVDAIICLVSLTLFTALGLLVTELLLVFVVGLVGCITLALICVALSHLTIKAAALKADNDLTI